MTKPAKWYVRPAKTRISLGIRPVWSESSLSAWRKLWSKATHWAHTDGGWPRLIWVFAGRTFILLVVSWGGSFWLWHYMETISLVSCSLKEPYIYINQMFTKKCLWGLMGFIVLYDHEHVTLHCVPVLSLLITFFGDQRARPWSESQAMVWLYCFALIWLLFNIIDAANPE